MLQEIKFDYDGEKNILTFKAPTVAVTQESVRKIKEISEAREVYINKEVNEIGDGAFTEFFKLRKVSFERNSSLKKIGARAFFGTEIETISIPDSVAEIGDCAFDNCRLLKRVTLTSPNLRAIGQCVFARTGIERISLPNTVSEIGNGAFSSCHDLKAVTFGNGLSKIGDDAFCETGLTEIVIPDNVTDIGEFAFYACTALREVTLSRNISRVRPYTFAETAIKNIDLSGIADIEECAFCGCTELTKVLFGNLLSTVGRHAFRDCALVKLELPNSATQIGDYSFMNNEELAEVRFNDGLQNIGKFAFSETAIKSVRLPDRLLAVDDGVFAGCESLESAEIGSSVKKIGIIAFVGTQIKSINLKNVLEICDKAFLDCRNLSRVTQCENVCKIGVAVFRNTKVRKMRLSDFCKCDKTAFPVNCEVTLVRTGAANGPAVQEEAVYENKPAETQSTIEPEDISEQPEAEKIVLTEEISVPQLQQEDESKIVESETAEQNPEETNADKSEATEQQPEQEKAVEPETAEQKPEEAEIDKPEAAEQQPEQEKAAEPETAEQKPEEAEIDKPEAADQQPEQEKAVEPETAEQKPEEAEIDKPEAAEQQPEQEKAVQQKTASDFKELIGLAQMEEQFPPKLQQFELAFEPKDITTERLFIHKDDINAVVLVIPVGKTRHDARIAKAKQRAKSNPLKLIPLSGKTADRAEPETNVWLTELTKKISDKDAFERLRSEQENRLKELKQWLDRNFEQEQSKKSETSDETDAYKLFEEETKINTEDDQKPLFETANSAVVSSEGEEKTAEEDQAWLFASGDNLFGEEYDTEANEAEKAEQVGTLRDELPQEKNKKAPASRILPQTQAVPKEHQTKTDEEEYARMRRRASPEINFEEELAKLEKELLGEEAVKSKPRKAREVNILDIEDIDSLFNV